VQVFVVTGAELATLVDSADLVGLLKRKLLELTKHQIQVFKSG
jgi:hypothetical protein